MEQEFFGKKLDYRLMVKLQLLQLLVLIRREYADWFCKDSGKVQSGYLAQMEQALDYIDRNLTEEIHLEEVAREAAMSSAYFSSLFKKLNGMTLWEYVQSRRIELASEKLLNTDRNVAEIAMECGYNSISNFNRSFKAITGQTPVAYRKANRE
jgi:AraC-like DNA-binding protein